MDKRTFGKGLSAGAALVLAAVARVGRAGIGTFNWSADASASPTGAILACSGNPRACQSSPRTAQGAGAVSRARNTNIRKSYFANGEALFPGL
jgi:hypothetical protein